MADRQAHAVSDADLGATRRLLAATRGLVGEPSDAERARTLVALATHATLATVATDRSAGYPFGSLVACVADDAGRTVLCLSDLAVHAVNLTADPRASVLVAAQAVGDPLAAARVTVVGDLREVPSVERAAVRDGYRRVHVDAFYAGFADFRVYRLEPTAVRYVGGFGRMSWVSTTDYREAEPDPLRSQSDRILDHMNADHADALVAFCQVLGGRAEVTAARMVGVDRYGFDVLATSGSGSPGAMRFGFDAPADTPDAVRAAMIALVRRTR
jgi:heme oxygenase (biliverdin-IX-beta and delta-forming)